jgi:hypothetical protein
LESKHPIIAAAWQFIEIGLVLVFWRSRPPPRSHMVEEVAISVVAAAISPGVCRP